VIVLNLFLEILQIQGASNDDDPNLHARKTTNNIGSKITAAQNEGIVAGSASFYSRRRRGWTASLRTG
jgi:hypothetical protein